MDMGRASPACSRQLTQSSGLTWDPVLRMNSEGRGSITPTVASGARPVEFMGQGHPACQDCRVMRLLEDKMTTRRHDVHHSTA